VKALTLIAAASICCAASLSQMCAAQCASAQGSCLELHGTPGCVVVECCEIVCMIDPQCCEGAWDQECVDNAVLYCDGLSCPSPGSCTVVHYSPGCDDSDCCHWTCMFDGFCCFTAWDAACVEETQLLCGAAPCTIEIPANAIDEVEPCYERFNDGCNLPDSGFIDVVLPATRSGKHASGSPRDTDWYRFSVASPTNVTFTLTAEFPTQLLLTQGDCFGPLETLVETHGLPCGQAVINMCLQPGTYACVIGAGVPSRVLRNVFTCDEVDPDAPPPDPKIPGPDPSPYGLRYVLQMMNGSCTFGDLNGDGVVGQADLAILLGSWGGSGAADLNNDGLVGSADLALLLGAWSS